MRVPGGIKMAESSELTIVNNQDINLELICLKKLSLPARSEVRKAVDAFTGTIKDIVERDARRRRKS